LSADPQLEKLRPFTSEDIDFKGGVADVQRIARQLELAPGYPPKVQMTALAGFIPIHIGDLKSAIEVVRRIPGISDAHTPAIQAERNGITIRVLDPIEWLKVANQVLKLTTSHRARKIAGENQLNWPEILPLTAIAKSQNERIQRFQEQQLEHGYKKSKGVSI